MKWDYLHKAQVEEHVCVHFSFIWFVYVSMCSLRPGPTQYIFHTPVARYSLYVLKVPLNTKQTNKHCLTGHFSGDCSRLGWVRLRFFQRTFWKLLVRFLQAMCSALWCHPTNGVKALMEYKVGQLVNFFIKDHDDDDKELTRSNES